MTSSPPLHVDVLGRSYRVVPPSIHDPRLHVAAVLLSVQVLGQTVLGFRVSVAQILACIVVGAAIELIITFARERVIAWPASGMLTGNSTAFILRVPGTLHGDWWSLHGIWIFVAVVAVSMASKYLIRWRGGHVFNPSNLGLVLAFIALGPRYTEPQDLWWIPFGTWLVVTYAILIVGGVLVGWELGLLGLEAGFMIGFAAFTALALGAVPDHCMVASWHLTPVCGVDLWTILVTSPEILVFALFMVPDPRTVPMGRAARAIFGVLVALLSVLFLGPTQLEFWTKTAILASLVIACAARYELARLVRVDASGARRALVRVAPAIALSLVAIGLIPVAADIPTHMPEPAAGAADGSTPPLDLAVGDGLAPSERVLAEAAAALPRPAGEVATPASERVWVLPPMPAIRIAANVNAFDPSMTQDRAAKQTRDAIRALVIASEARRTHDATLMQSVVAGDPLSAFTRVIDEDVKAGTSVRTTYVFDTAEVTLWQPKFTSQGQRLEGLTLRGTATVVTEDPSGRVRGRAIVPYDRTWGLTVNARGDWSLLNDYTEQGLVPAP